jgi:uncharacterized membrane protein
MGIVGAILAILSIISLAIAGVTISGMKGLGISENFTWDFWMFLAIFFMLGTIATLLIQRRNNNVD